MPAARLFPVRSIAAIVVLAMLSATAAASLPWGAAAEAAAARSVNVKIANFMFNPGVTTVSLGTQVTWTNNDDDAHSVVGDNKAFRSNPLDTGDTYSFTFNAPGTYTYHCGLHPQMMGKIVVTR
jgi:plastocyanin